jgi:hypothetical protein
MTLLLLKIVLVFSELPLYTHILVLNNFVLFHRSAIYLSKARSGF